jgi:hypothetical protein
VEIHVKHILISVPLLSFRFVCLFSAYFSANSGINSEITYSIQTDNNKNSSEYFHIDENEGTVVLKKSLDHETLQHHHFTIRVSDKGSPALSSSKQYFWALKKGARGGCERKYVGRFLLLL